MIELDFADVRPSVGNFLIVGIMAALFIWLVKWASLYLPWPGVRDAFHSL